MIEVEVVKAVDEAICNFIDPLATLNTLRYTWLLPEALPALCNNISSDSPEVQVPSYQDMFPV